MAIGDRSPELRDISMVVLQPLHGTCLMKEIITCKICCRKLFRKKHQLGNQATDYWKVSDRKPIVVFVEHPAQISVLCGRGQWPSNRWPVLLPLGCKKHLFFGTTDDGRNPAPPGMYKTTGDRRIS